MRTPFTAAILGFSLCLLPAQAAPQFVNGLTLDGAAVDKSGGTGVNNGRLGYFSDLYYDRAVNQWWGLSDRGPGGGTISYDTRLQRFSLDVNPATGAISNFAVQQTVLFRNGNQTFNGLAPNPANTLGNSFDPEGMVILPQSGNFLVSDEYGASVYEFRPSGQFVRQYQTPANLVPKVGANVNFTATSSTLTAGRENNRGLEGLAVSPDGRFAYAMLQNGTITDGNGSGGSFARSRYTRIIKYDTSTGNAVAQYAYLLDGTGPAPAQGRGISAIVALDENRFMVLERNNRGVGVPDANLSSPDKKVYIIDISGASDVSAINLNTTTLPTGVNPVAKNASSLVNLAAANILNDSSLTALGGRSPEKWEGLAIGPQLNDGSYLLLAGTDNDYSVTQNGSNVQFDVYYKPSTGERVQCDLGLTINCRSISSGGAVNTSPIPDVGNLPPDFALIPGTLIAFKASANDLGGYTPPTTPVPGPLPVAGALAGLGWSRRLRQRLAGLNVLHPLGGAPQGALRSSECVALLARAAEGAPGAGTVQDGAQVYRPLPVRFSEACERNKEPILLVLRDWLPPRARVLEVGSGSGQHAVHFGRHLAGLQWQPSDRAEYLDDLRERISLEGRSDLAPEARLADPIELDVDRPDQWPSGPYEAVFSANTTHIMAADSVPRLLAGAARLLAPGGLLLLYGPFLGGGVPTAASNADFDAHLRSLDPSMGVRDAAVVREQALSFGLDALADGAMPANNRILVFRKGGGVS